jgi:O-methyltransferase
MQALARSTNEPVNSVGYLESVIPDNRLAFLWQLCRETLRSVPGNVLEVGVYKGGSLLGLVREAAVFAPECEVWGVDTFSGHPYSDGHPVHPAGKYGDVNLSELRNALVAAGCCNVHLEQQLVEGGISAAIRDLSFVHVDCDLYRPVLYCALSLPPRMKPGGIIYFDDFGHDHCPGATSAILEALQRDARSPLFGAVRRDVHMVEDNTKWSCYIQIEG